MNEFGGTLRFETQIFSKNIECTEFKNFLYDRSQNVADFLRSKKGELAASVVFQGASDILDKMFQPRKDFVLIQQPGDSAQSVVFHETQRVSSHPTKKEFLKMAKRVKDELQIPDDVMQKMLETSNTLSELVFASTDGWGDYKSRQKGYSATRKLYTPPPASPPPSKGPEGRFKKFINKFRETVGGVRSCTNRARQKTMNTARKVNELSEQADELIEGNKFASMAKNTAKSLAIIAILGGCVLAWVSFGPELAKNVPLPGGDSGPKTGLESLDKQYPGASNYYRTEIINWNRIVNNQLEGWDVTIPTELGFLKSTDKAFRTASIMAFKDQLLKKGLNTPADAEAYFRGIYSKEDLDMLLPILPFVYSQDVDGLDTYWGIPIPTPSPEIGSVAQRERVAQNSNAERSRQRTFARKQGKPTKRYRRG